MKIIRHCDNVVSVRAELCEPAEYLGSISEFQEEAKVTLPPLPAGMTSYDLDTETGVIVYYDAKGGAHPRIAPSEATPTLLACKQDRVPQLKEAAAKRRAVQAAWDEALAEDAAISRPSPIDPPRRSN